MNVVRASFIECLARLALAAGLTVGLWSEAVDSLGKDARTGGFSHAARTAEEVGMCQAATLNGVLQRHCQRALSHHRVERHRAVLACRNDIVLHNRLCF